MTNNLKEFYDFAVFEHSSSGDVAQMFKSLSESERSEVRKFLGDLANVIRNEESNQSLWSA